MQYFAGLFDAEGYVSVCPKGSFTIAVEMTNEEVPKIFQKEFGGSIYERKRDDRKKSYTWKINSIHEQAMHFLNSIIPFSIVKITQLHRLKDYLDQPRMQRKFTREITCKTLKNLKKPTLRLEHIFPRIHKPTDPHFFKWLAGFIDGDGNFTCHEYIDNRNNKKYFSHQISVANTFLESISYINDRIEGCITILSKNEFPIFKWVPRRSSEKLICNSIFPFLIIKKEQCLLLEEFSSCQDRIRKYEIINQIKHLNSL